MITQTMPKFQTLLTTHTYMGCHQIAPNGSRTWGPGCRDTFRGPGQACLTTLTLTRSGCQSPYTIITIWQHMSNQRASVHKSIEWSKFDSDGHWQEYNNPPWSINVNATQYAQTQVVKSDWATLKACPPTGATVTGCQLLTTPIALLVSARVASESTATMKHNHEQYFRNIGLAKLLIHQLPHIHKQTTICKIPCNTICKSPRNTICRSPDNHTCPPPPSPFGENVPKLSVATTLPTKT